MGTCFDIVKKVNRGLDRTIISYDVIDSQYNGLKCTVSVTGLVVSLFNIAAINDGGSGRYPYGC